MKRSPTACLLLAVWLVALAALGGYVQRTLTIGTDLRLFLPHPQTAEERLLLQEVGAGPGSRLLVVAIAGAEPIELAAASQALAARLSASEHFSLVANGEISPEALPDELLPYRYLLSPTFDQRPLDADFLRGELTARLADLAAPGSAFLESLLPRDPTLELLTLVRRWQPVHEPHRQYEVWFDETGTRALLVAETRAAAFDPDRQQLALDELHAAFREIDPEQRLRFTTSGAGAFSALMKERTAAEAGSRGTLATVALIALLLLVYRRTDTVLLGALPLASGALAGLFAVTSLFGVTHGITLAFGFTLLGVALDYPMHVFSHQRRGRPAIETARALWPTLATGVASTCIGYFAFAFSGVTGLVQLACFTVTGLAAAGLSTRFLLPYVMTPAAHVHADAPALAGLWNRLQVVRLPRWLAPGAAVIAVMIIAAAPGPTWENDLSKLTPVPEQLLKEDAQLRAQLGTPDLRYLLAVEAPDIEQALMRLEGLDAAIEALQQRGAIAGYQHAARYLPSARTQLARRERLPAPTALQAALSRAIEDTAFRPDVFAPFLRDAERARSLPPLTLDSLRATALGATLDMLLRQRAEGVLALVAFTGVMDPAALQDIALAAGPNAILLDMRAASESLVARQRARILWMLVIAGVLLVVTVAVALRERSRVLRTLAPVALSCLLLLALLRAAGGSLTLFHLVALTLAAGLGLDYALFFERAARRGAEDGRHTLHAVLVCAGSTLLVFALLATSSLPVLRAIGVTVALGVLLNVVLAALLIKRAPDDS